MDNEWSLWDSTHRDVHPIGATMTRFIPIFCNYATMVKGLDRTRWSPARKNGAGRAIYTAATTNNGRREQRLYPGRLSRPQGTRRTGFWAVVFEPVQQRSQTAGRRLLDIFTLHCYPQEGNVGNNAVDSATELLRNESTACSGTPITRIPVGSKASSCSFPNEDLGCDQLSRHEDRHH